MAETLTGTCGRIWNKAVVAGRLRKIRPYDSHSLRQPSPASPASARQARARGEGCLHRIPLRSLSLDPDDFGFTLSVDARHTELVKTVHRPRETFEVEADATSFFISVLLY